LFVDGGDDGSTNLGLTLLDAHDVAAQTGEGLDGVGDLAAEAVALERAGISDLAAALRVEGRTVEEDAQGAVGPGNDADDLGGRGEGLAAHELGGAVLGQHGRERVGFVADGDPTLLPALSGTTTLV